MIEIKSKRVKAIIDFVLYTIKKVTFVTTTDALT